MEHRVVSEDPCIAGKRQAVGNHSNDESSLRVVFHPGRDEIHVVRIEDPETPLDAFILAREILEWRDATKECLAAVVRHLRHGAEPGQGVVMTCTLDGEEYEVQVWPKRRSRGPTPEVQ
jgi:hypothetical protein